MANAIEHPCPHCGTRYQLTADYLAQYGGQATSCTSCGGQFTLPTELPAAAPAQPAAGPPALPPGGPGAAAGQPMQVLAYSGPAYGQAAGPAGVWSDGTQIVAANGAALPYCCVKCGAAADGPPTRKTFYWHHPAVYIAILSPLIYIILALVLRKSGAVTYGLCARHKSKKTWGALTGVGLFLLGIVLIVVGANDNDLVFLIPLGILVMIGGAIAGLLLARVLMPNKIDERFLWLRGASPDVLRMLPPVPTPGYGGYAGAYAGGYASQGYAPQHGAPQQYAPQQYPAGGQPGGYR